MLHLNLKPLLEAHSVEQPFAFLRRAGFTHNTAHRLLNNPLELHLKYIERLCRILNCLPNDLLEYAPDPDHPLPQGHPLTKLRRKESRGNLAKELRNLPAEDLEKIWGLMDDLKKTETDKPTHGQPTNRLPLETIILAGGLGTRLAGVIGDVPKCMAPVAGKPFISYLVDYLERNGCTRLVLSLGYRHEQVLGWIGTRAFLFPVDYAIEREPLGTGGGIRKAILKTAGENVCVVNGDTFFDVDLSAGLRHHTEGGYDATLALKPMKDFSRYGTVQLAESGAITAFAEKQPMTEGLINGGIYFINREAFLSTPLPEKFSFEKDYLEAHVGSRKLGGYISDSYFIDIGVPEDYERVQGEIISRQ